MAGESNMLHPTARSIPKDATPEQERAYLLFCQFWLACKHYLPRPPRSFQTWLSVHTATLANAEKATIVGFILREQELAEKLGYLTQQYNEVTADNVLQCIEAVGPDEVLRLLGLLSLNDAVGTGLPLFGLSKHDMLRHAALTGYYMCEFATAAEISPIDGQCIGIWHGLGRWVMQESIKKANLFIDPCDLDMDEHWLWENNHFGTHHGEITASYMTEFLQVPDHYMDTVAFYPTPTKSTLPRVSALLKVASFEAQQRAFPKQKSIMPDIVTMLSVALGLDSKTFKAYDSMVPALFQQVDKICQLS